MDYEEWERWYHRIISVFGYSRAEDQRAADVLSLLLEGRAVPLRRLRRLITCKPVLILGAGPSLEDDLNIISKRSDLDGVTLIAADGATSAVLQVLETAPRIVVTDLDGDMGDLIKADRLGALMVVHGHGDNIPVIEEVVPKLLNTLGTTQARARPNVYNFGGFTDGDRAVFIAVEMVARLIVLAGMDFGREVGKYSKTKPRPLTVKRRKLGMGKALLEWLSSRTQIPLYNATSRGEEIRGFRKIAPEELASIL